MPVLPGTHNWLASPPTAILTPPCCIVKEFFNELTLTLEFCMNPTLLMPTVPIEPYWDGLKKRKVMQGKWLKFCISPTTGFLRSIFLAMVFMYKTPNYQKTQFGAIDDVEWGLEGEKDVCAAANKACVVNLD
eukprot:1136126-Pelagomonas_calceolata.AAC.1